jgi:hypothetical protein
MEVPSLLINAEYLLIVFNLLLLGFYLYRMSQFHPSARGSVQLLVRGAYAFTFIGLVLVVGLFGAFFFSVMQTWAHWTAIIALVAACELIGSFALLMIFLKSGLLAPQSAYPD